MSSRNKVLLGLLVSIVASPVAFGVPAPTLLPTAPVAKIPNTTTATMVVYDKFDGEIRVGGRVKADFNYDFNGKQPRSTSGLDPSVMPLKKWDYDANRTHNFNASLTSSRISLDVKHQYGCLESYGYGEIDFNGGLNGDTRTSNNYIPRIRHFYWELTDTNKVNNWLFGQTWTNFSTPDINPYSTNNTWPTYRTAQIRYTRAFTPCIKLALSLEKPDVQYFQLARSGAGVNTPITFTAFDDDTANTMSKSPMPDLTFQLKYQKDVTFFALRGVVRRLDIKTTVRGAPGGNIGQDAAVDNFQKHKTAWGLGASAMFKIANPLTFILQIQGGDGVGRYIDDLANGQKQDGIFQYRSGSAATIINRFETFKAINFIGGFTLKWRDNLESSIGAAYTKIQNPKNIHYTVLSQADGTTGQSNINSSTLPNNILQRYHVNLVYSIVPKGYMIIEAEQCYRKAFQSTQNGQTYNGKDTRIVVSFIRNF